MHKFIITNNGEFRHGAVNYHNQLLKKDETTCLGGGFVTFDFDKKHVVLSGKSFDFGYPKTEQLTTFDWRYEDWTWEYDPYK